VQRYGIIECISIGLCFENYPFKIVRVPVPVGLFKEGNKLSLSKEWNYA